MHTSDYASRQPTECKNPRCQICSFVAKWEMIGDNASAIRTVSVEDVKSGRSLMPFAQRSVWLNIQKGDSVHQQLTNLIRTGQLPQSKKTGGDNTRLKLLHNLYTQGKLQINKDGLILVRSQDGFFEGSAISVPHVIFPGLVNAIHIRMDHPSKAQLCNVVSRFFYAPGWKAMTEQVSDNCHQCAALRILPKVLTQDKIEQIQAFVQTMKLM